MGEELQIGQREAERNAQSNTIHTCPSANTPWILGMRERQRRFKNCALEEFRPSWQPKARGREKEQ